MRTSSVARGVAKTQIGCTTATARIGLANTASSQFEYFANTALATGIGGTIVTLRPALLPRLIEAPQAAISSHVALQDLLDHMGIALIASAIGVVNNLLILLVLLPLGNKRFDQALKQLYDKTPRDARQQQAGRDTCRGGSRQAREAFKDAVERFPDAFALLDDSVEALGGDHRDTDERNPTGRVRLEGGCRHVSHRQARRLPQRPENCPSPSLAF